MTASAAVAAGRLPRVTRSASREGPVRLARLRPYDLHCLAAETPSRPLHVGVLAIVDGDRLLDASGRFDLEAARHAIAARLASLPELRRVVHRPPPLAGPPLWVADRGFRVERHVDAAEAPTPGDEAALLAVVEGLVAVPLARDRPLWRLWFVTGLEGGRIAALLLIHHALADGLAAMRLGRALLQAAPPVGDATCADAPSDAVPSWPALVLDNLASVVEAAAALARPRTWRRLGVVAGAAWGAASSALGLAPSSLNAPVGPGRRLEVVRLDLGDAKRVARRHACGANDVVLALVSGGVRALLTARGEAIAGVRPRAGIAVATRTAAPDHRVGNDIGSLHVPLPIDEPDPAVRLPLIAAARARALASPILELEPVLRASLGRLPFARRSFERQRLVNLSETWVPGPARAIDVLGAPVLALVPIAPLAGNLALSFVALSYAGEVAVTIRADAATFPDLDVLVHAIEREWSALRAGVG